LAHGLDALWQELVFEQPIVEAESGYHLYQQPLAFLASGGALWLQDEHQYDPYGASWPRWA
jgi:hypothetical protein